MPLQQLTPLCSWLSMEKSTKTLWKEFTTQTLFTSRNGWSWSMNLWKAASLTSRETWQRVWQSSLSARIRTWKIIAFIFRTLWNAIKFKSILRAAKTSSQTVNLGQIIFLILKFAVMHQGFLLKHLVTVLVVDKSVQLKNFSYHGKLSALKIVWIPTRNLKSMENMTSKWLNRC